jgi:hypothetical protein
MFRLMALVNGPDGEGPEGLAKGFADDAEQRAAYGELRASLIERLVRDGLPAWALGTLEKDKAIRAANRAAARLQDRHAEAVRLEAARARATSGHGEDPGLAALIDAQRAYRRAQRRFLRRAAKVGRGP